MSPNKTTNSLDLYTVQTIPTHLMSELNYWELLDIEQAFIMQSRPNNQ